VLHATEAERSAQTGSVRLRILSGACETVKTQTQRVCTAKEANHKYPVCGGTAERTAQLVLVINGSQNENLGCEGYFAHHQLVTKVNDYSREITN
jgi:hypothetical protein